MALLSPMETKLTHNLNKRYSIAVKDKVPSYIVSEAKEQLIDIKAALKAWRAVINGSDPPEPEHMQPDYITELAKKANTTNNNLSTMLEIAGA